MSWGETLFLSKIIKGQKTFVASDNTLVSLSSENNKAWGRGEIVAKFVPKTNGSVRLISDMCTTNDIYSGEIEIIKDGVKIAGLFTEDAEYKVLTTDFQVEKGAEYLIRCIGESVGDVVVYTSYIRLGADIIDGSLFEYELN